jgi:hypothetical protein
MSALGHKRTHADISSFDHFIRTSERDIKRVGYGHMLRRLCAAFSVVPLCGFDQQRKCFV